MKIKTVIATTKPPFNEWMEYIRKEINKLKLKK